MIVASANYSCLSLVDIGFRTIQLLFLSTPIALGGLGLDPPTIGTIMSFYGVLHGIFVVLFFSRLTDRFGARGVYLVGVAAAVPCFSLFPIINLLARNSVEHSGGLGTGVWVAVGLQVVGGSVICLSYGTSASKRLGNPLICFRLFRRGVHPHRRCSTQQGLFGSHEWLLSSVGVYRARHRTRPGELGVLAFDRRRSPLYERGVGVLSDFGAEFWCDLGGVVVAEASLEG